MNMFQTLVLQNLRTTGVSVSFTVLCVNDLPEKRVEDDRNPLRSQADVSTLNEGRTVCENNSLARIRDSPLLL